MSRKGDSTVGKRVWQSSALVSSTTTLNREVVPIGVDIEPVGESCVEVDPRNTSDERLMFRKNPTCGEERGFGDCGHSVHKNWRGACVKDRCTRKHHQVEPLEKGIKRTKKPMIVSLDCITQENGNVDTTLEYENEPSPEVFQEAKIYLYVDVVVRITDDSPLLSWILHFAVRFLNKTRTGRRWKESVEQIVEEELTSSVKCALFKGCWSVIMIEQEQFHSSPRVELYEREVGHDRSFE